MNRSRVGMILVLVGSLAIGVLAGVVARMIFLKHVSSAELSAAEKLSATGTYLTAGVVLGVVIAIWSIVVAWIAPRFRKTRPDTAA